MLFLPSRQQTGSDEENRFYHLCVYPLETWPKFTVGQQEEGMMKPLSFVLDKCVETEEEVLTNEDIWGGDALFNSYKISKVKYNFVCFLIC
jgi:hypothetical protein